MELQTQRLRLRPPIAADADDYLEICNSEFVLRYNAMTPKSREDVLNSFSRDREDTILLELKATGKVIGAVFLEEDSLRWGVESKELSYFLREEYARQGYMKEALGAVIDKLFRRENLTCVAARAFAPNTASRALLNSLGFHQDGYIRQCVKGYQDQIFDDTIHSLFRGEWIEN